MFDAARYPNLARFDSIVGDFLSKPQTKDMDKLQIEQEICRINPFYWATHYGKIEAMRMKGRDVRIIPFIFNTPQEILADKIAPLLYPREWKPGRIVVLKSRKMGVSTFFAFLDYWFMRFIERCGTFVIADKGAHTSNILKMIDLFWREDTLPGKPHNIPMQHNKKGLHLSNHSLLEIDSGETKHPGTSQTIRTLHMCVDPSTPVITSDGFLVPAERMLGKPVQAHNIRPAKVTAIHPSHATDGYAINIFGNPFELRVTKDHRLFAREGRGGSWVKAWRMANRKSSKYGQWYVGYPIRPFWGGDKRQKTLDKKLKTRPRVHGGGRHHGNYPDVFPLSSEMGRLVGWYLAEGSIARAMKKYPSAITLACHGHEVKRLTGIVDSVGEETLKAKGRKLTGQRGEVVVHSSFWAKVFLRLFGQTDRKRIPDWVWATNEQFAQGIIRGYLEGDGHLVADGLSILITSVRPQLLIQIRELLLSLGYGYSSLYYREAGSWYGRNCKASWTLGIFGETAFHTRTLMKVPAKKPSNRKHWKMSGFHVKGGHPRIWLPIRSIEPCRIENPIDLEVDHPLHSYMLLGCASHNSENAKWTHIRDAETSLLNSVPRDGWSWIVKESTAHGINKWKDDCEAAMEKKSSWMFVFLEWPDMPDCAIELASGERFDPTPEEMEIRETYSLTLQQLKFRRQKILDIGRGGFHQEFPLNPREPFLASSSSYFNIELVEDRIDELEFYRVMLEQGYDEAILQFDRIRREIAVYEPGAEHYIHRLSERCACPRTMEISIVKGAVTYRVVEENREDAGHLLMWREPDRRRKYVVSVDPAGSMSAGGESRDLSVIEVFDSYSREQVAEFAGHYDEDVLAKYAVMISRLYLGAILAIETNGTCGGTVMTYVKERYKYTHLYQRQILTGKQTFRVQEGWHTSPGNKQAVCHALKIQFKEDDCVLYSVPLLTEMLKFVEEKGKLKAAENATDDRIMASSIALKIIETTPALRRMKRSDAQWAIERSIPRNPIFDKIRRPGPPSPVAGGQPSDGYRSMPRYGGVSR